MCSHSRYTLCTQKAQAIVTHLLKAKINVSLLLTHRDRFFKRLWAGWFTCHIAMQYFGLAVVFAGFMTILQSVSYRGVTHFNNPHAILGKRIFTTFLWNKKT